MPNPTGQACATCRRSPRIGAGLLWLIGLIGFLYALTALAAPTRALILLSETGGAYHELVDSLDQQLTTTAPGAVELKTQLAPENSEQLAELLAEPPALILTVGIRATALALREAGNIPVLSLLVPYDSYNSLLDNTKRGDGSSPTHHSAIYLDQPLGRQLNLLTLLLPSAVHVAVLSSPATQQHVVELKRLCRERGLQLHWQLLENDTNPVPALTSLMEQADVLIALPDPSIFNRNSLQAILLTTYRSDVPVLGFSQAYVRAGALSAVYSTAQQIGRQAGEWIAELSKTSSWQLGIPRYPRYYSVAVNNRVAQSLNLSVSNENVLLHQLQQLENRSP